MKKALTHRPAVQPGRAPLTRRVRLAGGLAVIGLIAGLGLLASRPAHTAGGPVAVTVANVPLRVTDSEAARTPFAINVSPGAGQSATFTVPAGKRLVIQQVSAITNSSTARDIEIDSYVSGVGGAVWVPFAVSSHGEFYANGALTDYADPGSTVYVNVGDSASTIFDGYTVDIIGYTVDVP